MGKCEQCMVRKLNSIKELSKEELLRISHCKTIQIIKKGEIIFNEGDYVNGVFCIKSGICKVSKMSENGREQIIHLIKRGDLLGQRSLISDEVANLKATAVNDMEVCFIPKQEILKDLHKNPNFSMSVLKNMANSLKDTDNIVVNMAQKSVRQRLASSLLYLEENFGVNKDGSVNINLTREDIANIIGTATESTIRLLSEFKKKDYIKLVKKEIVILNRNELKSISEGI